jgi:nicotinamidase-related amidase
MARAALFVIDIQVNLAQNPTTEIPYAARIREAGTTILQRARQAIDSSIKRGRAPDLEIVFVQHKEVEEKGPLVKGSRAWELVFQPRVDDRWEKLVEKDVRESHLAFRLRYS